MPKRIQRKRTKDWKMPENCLYVGRPTRWGNPFSVAVITDGVDVVIDHVDPYGLVESPAAAVELYHWWMKHTVEGRAYADAARHELAGHDLACWCSLDQPCHADVLLELANA